MARPIYLLSDFGVQDIYVGVMKSVIHQIAPKSHVIDLNHGIASHSIMSGAYQIQAALPYLETESVIVGVVDPGVGGARRPIALELNTGPILVGPDNGLFSLAVAQYGLKTLVNLEDSPFNLDMPSNTFHGRDIFSPNGAALSKSADFESIGPIEADLQIVELDNIQCEVQERLWRATALHVDHFGNVITSLPHKELTLKGQSLSCKGQRFRACETFSEATVGEFLMYIGSSGHLELAMNQGAIAQELDIGVGDSIDILVL